MMRRSWIMVVGILLLPAFAFGQAQTTGRITGSVLDEQGQALPGVEVTVTSQDRNIDRESVTDESGRFAFALLPPGGYTVAATLPGFQAGVYRVPVRIGETVPLDIRLLPGGEVISEEVTVVGTAGALETTTTGESFDYDTMVNQLPITNRELEDVAFLSPNVFSGPTAGTLSIAGAPSFDTTVLVDGAEVSDPYFGAAPVVYIEDALDQVQVLTAGVSARYGRFQGGVVNAVTKSGGNEFEGTFRLELENEDWNSASPIDEPQEDDLQKSYQAVLGGPVVRERLWFFVGGRTIPETSEAELAVSGETIVGTQSEDRWQVKLSGAVTPSHMLEVSHLEYESETSGYTGLTAGDGLAAGTRADPREITSLAYNGVLSDETFLEIQGTRKNVNVLSGGTPNGRSPFIDNNLVTVFNNHWWDFSDPSVRDNETYSGALTHYLDTDSLGLHGLEGGVQYVKSVTGGENRQSVTGLNLLALNTGEFFAGKVDGESRFNLVTGRAARWKALNLGGDQEIENLAAYVQDSVQLDRWRFDVGVRWEKYEGSGPVLPFELDFSEIVPRLGVTYSLAPDWQLQATYGRYISRLNDNVGNAVTGVGNAPRVTSIYLGPTMLNATPAQVEAALRNDAFWPLIVGVVDAAQPTSFAASDLTSPYSDDITLSLRHSFAGSRGSAVLTLIDRQYENLIDDFVGGVCAAGFDFDLACPTGDVVEVTLDGETFPLDSTVWGNHPDAFREYRAATLVTDYWATPNWMIGGNYTYSRLEGNYEGEGTNTPASGSGLGDYPLARYEGSAPSGRLFADVPHRLNLWSTYNLDAGSVGRFVLGSILQYRSGRPWNRAANIEYRPIDDYIAEEGNVYTHFFTRGRDRFEDVWSLDGSVRYELPLFTHLSPWLMLSVTNLLDNDELIQHSTAGAAVTDANGDPVLDSQGRPQWRPVGNCGPGDEPSRDCTGWGRIRNELDYQLPREFQMSVGLRF